jgi:hypothetical protein
VEADALATTGQLALRDGSSGEAIGMFTAAIEQAGTELFIAPKTVSVHVSNILGKLGAASRTEAAAIAHRETARRF